MVTLLFAGLQYTMRQRKGKGVFVMLESVYGFWAGDAKRIEKIIDDDPVLINHMILPKGEGLPEHYSNSNVYMIIVRGAMTLKLNEQEPHLYTSGHIINIPYKTKMNVSNHDDPALEFFVVKAPNPRHYKEG
jgi:quercetin dioxygenase-like cupin family protein